MPYGFELSTAQDDASSPSGSRSIVWISSWAAMVLAAWSFMQFAMPASANKQFTGKSEDWAILGFTCAVAVAFLVAGFKLHKLYYTFTSSWRKHHVVNSILWPLVGGYLFASQTAAIRAREEDLVRTLFEPFVNPIAPTITKDTVREFNIALTVLKSLWGVEITAVGWLLVCLVSNALAAKPANHIVWLTAGGIGFVGVCRIIGRIIQRKLSRIADAEVDEVLRDKRRELSAAMVKAFPQTLGVVTTRTIETPVGGSATMSEELSLASMLKTSGEIECKIAEAFVNAEDLVVLRHPENLTQGWVFKFVPAIIHARQRGVRIHIFAQKSDEQSVGLQFLSLLGCVVEFKELSTDPSDTFSGLLKDPERSTAHLICFPPVRDVLWGTSMEGPLVRGLVAALAPATSLQQPTTSLPSLESVPTELLKLRLRQRVPDYANVEIWFDEVAIDRTRPMTKMVREVGDIQFESLERSYIRAGIRPFGPAMIRVQNGMYSPLLPPVLELDDDGTYRVHEGHTRAYRTWKRWKAGRGSPSLSAVIVKGAQRPSRIGPYHWEDADLTPDPDYEDKRWKHSRDIEERLRTLPVAGSTTKRALDLITDAEISEAKKWH